MTAAAVPGADGGAGDSWRGSGFGAYAGPNQPDPPVRLGLLDLAAWEGSPEAEAWEAAPVAAYEGAARR